MRFQVKGGMRSTEYAARAEGAPVDLAGWQAVVAQVGTGSTGLIYVRSVTTRGFTVTTEHTYQSTAEHEAECRRQAGHGDVRIVDKAER